ncbi:MAG: hypothetical protein EHM36_04180 [Deltaproteobacteria bacterium]|nr:MAG: hypothetical protein EHM36_04180 [Deltaproteobacteria bacterium]
MNESLLSVGETTKRKDEPTTCASCGAVYQAEDLDRLTCIAVIETRKKLLCERCGHVMEVKHG